MNTREIEFTQINLHHCIAANLCRDITMGHTGVVLIQEPWVNKSMIMGFGYYKKRVFSGGKGGRIRAAMYVAPKYQTMLMRQFSDEDTAVVRITRDTAHGGDLLIGSCYMPDTADTPYTQLLTDAIEFSKVKGIPILLGCDANSHHTVWGSTNINPRGSLLLQFIAGADLEILNRGNVPTFVTKDRMEVLDITIASEGLANQIDSWRVSLTPNFSDHRTIKFRLRGWATEVVKFRNPRRTNWEQYRNFLRQHVENKLETVLPRSSLELDEAVNSITWLLTKAYESSCPEGKEGSEEKWETLERRD